MTLKEFKNEFRNICTDTWGDALDAWFECAGRLNIYGAKLPENWKYKRAVFGSPCNKESHFFYDFKASKVKELRTIGNFLYRYCQYLQFKGKSY